MPTPHGTRGGLAFSADEVRTLRRALAESRSAECAALAAAVADAAGEAAALRAFLRAELRRYREALPGAAAGYMERLAAAVGDGHLPGPEDLSALRRLRAQAPAGPEHERRTALLRRCENLAVNDDVRQRLEAHMPAPRRLLTLPGPSAADQPKPAPKPGPGAPRPASPQPPAPEPGRRTPTPAEIWPPRPSRPEPPAKDAAAVVGPRSAL
ncbi:hypothetical protein [Streptomyces sp. NPDC020983]|uniref:hypothetical protein n=1 Tax=Streptomyces sp. NPDC020983 TaxID=3365106 RepID=UPI0037B3BA78